jgi:DNA-binding winged helix-turn-helix (wHTH) protein
MRILVTLDDTDELQFARVLRLLATEGLPMQVLPPEAAPTGRGVSGERPVPGAPIRDGVPMESVVFESLELPGLLVDPDRYMARVEGIEVPLSLLEFRLLYTLAIANRVISRAELLQRIWGREIKKRDRGVDAFVKKLRDKLAVPGARYEYIHTAYRIGYFFEARPVGSEPRGRDARGGGHLESEAPRAS